MTVNVGIDVGSTTIKCCAIDKNLNVLYKSYERHEAKQGEKLLNLLDKLEKQFGRNFNLFMTGSGATTFSKILNAKFIQEVNAVSLAVETFKKETNTVIELGGQDAKMIFRKEANGKKLNITTMNDKCAGGTGATIDRILMKLKIPSEAATKIPYTPSKVYPVAAKCGVFAETDITGLQKAGVPAEDLLISLFDAIILQNLTILTRGNTIKPKVLLLGGPNFFFKGLQEAWKYHLTKLWKEKNIKFDNSSIEVPENSQFFAALGAASSGKLEKSPYKGKEKLQLFLTEGYEKLKKETGIKGLIKDTEEFEIFKEKYSLKEIPVRKLESGEIVEGYLGIDGGSTSTKVVLIDKEKNLIAKEYTISSGNPIDDIKNLLSKIEEKVEKQGCKLKIKGVAVTGYAKDMLKKVLKADIAIVETVAHTISALHFFKNIDVILDVGGQDIKIIFMKNNRVKDFKLNTQCSAGNGYFLQSTAERFGYKIDEYADAAFKAKYAPNFNFGCAVFLEQDIVDFQRLGWKPEEIMAGLAKVLPKNIWLYVVQEPNIRKFGKRFLLQGGTHKNLTVVKAQHDYIKEKIPEAEILLHPLTGEAGAFGAAIEATKIKESSFIGIENLQKINVTIESNENTRCTICPNRCVRTFIKINKTETFIIAPCEKGTADSKESLKEKVETIKKIKKIYLNLQEEAAKRVFSTFYVEKPIKKINLTIGIPKVLNFYSLTPFFLGYFKTFEIDVIFSPFTSEKLIKEELKGGAIDPCFPSKIALTHISYLLKKKPDIIFFPKILTLPSFLKDIEDSAACPTVSGTPMVVKAILTKEEDLFRKYNIQFIDPILHFNDIKLLTYEMFTTFRKILKISKKENRIAVENGLKSLKTYNNYLQEQGKKILENAEKNRNMVILALGRPYHNDPGINHGILEEIQFKGFPILTIESLPKEEKFLKKVFKDEDPLKISHVYKKSYSENTNGKIWGALYASKHPNIAVLDLSSFRCGPDAPTYKVIEKIMEKSNTPYFTFHEIDENRPSGAIKIRVETIEYFLRNHKNNF